MLPVGLGGSWKPVPRQHPMSVGVTRSVRLGIFAVAITEEGCRCEYGALAVRDDEQGVVVLPTGDLAEQRAVARDDLGAKAIVIAVDAQIGSYVVHGVEVSAKPFEIPADVATAERQLAHALTPVTEVNGKEPSNEEQGGSGEADTGEQSGAVGVPWVAAGKGERPEPSQPHAPGNGNPNQCQWEKDGAQ